MRKVILFFCLLSGSYFIVAQSNDDFLSNEKTLDYDTSKIQSHSDKLGIYAYSIRKFRTYELKNKEVDKRLKFEPNGQTNLGLGFNYKWMGVGIAVGLPFMNKDNDIYGETSRFDLQLNLFSRFFGVSAYYQNYQGFYLSNPDDFYTWDNKSPYPLLSDLQSASIGASAFYFFNNKKFSYKAAFVRNEVQRRSAGGFVLGGYFDLDVVTTRSGFIPEELPDSLENIFDFNGYSTYIAGVSFGYAYTLVFLKRTFINLSLVPGIGYRNLSIWYITSITETKPSFSGSINSRVSIGYEGKRLYLGLLGIVNAESFKYESVDISSNTGQIRFYIGKRFNVGKKNKPITLD